MPRKIVARHEGIWIYDKEGVKRQELKPAVPYFVFDDDGDRVLVGRVQDSALANGWVRKDDVYDWPTRRLAYPKITGDVAISVVGNDGRPRVLRGHLRELGDESSPLPWPILAGSHQEGEILVLADLRSLGGETTPMESRNTTCYNYFVIYTQTELDLAAANLLNLTGLLDSGKIEAGLIPRMLGTFLTQNNVDFLDLNEVRQTLAVFPGDTPDSVYRAEFLNQTKRLSNNLKRQIDLLLRISTSYGCYNEAHGVYVVKLEELSREFSHE